MAHFNPPVPDPPTQVDVFKAYLMDRRRALLAEVAAIEKLLGIERPRK
jgi:hypothetical protein